MHRLPSPKGALTLLPLYGGGYRVAFMQVLVVYYAAASILHWVVPALVTVHSVEKGRRRPGQVAQEAWDCLGEMPPHQGAVLRVACVDAHGCRGAGRGQAAGGHAAVADR